MKNASPDMQVMEASSEKNSKAQQNKEKEKIKNEAWGETNNTVSSYKMFCLI